MDSHGEEGEVYVWDMRRRLCIHRFTDDGCISGTCVATGGDYLATGSTTGVVNVYNTRAALLSTSTPRPVRAVMNLVTPITCLKFNHTAEILAMTSRFTDNAVKLLHVPSMTVFKNFPDTKRYQLHKVLSLDISQGSGYLAMGNIKGSANL